MYRLLLYFEGNGQATIERLASDHLVSVRTMERDLAALRDAGADVRRDGQGRFYRASPLARWPARERKLTRLLRLAVSLEGGGAYTVQELTWRLHASPRTVKRDLLDVDRYGLPLDERDGRWMRASFA